MIPEYIELDKSSGTGNSTVQVTAAENTGSQRSSLLTIKTTEGEKKTVSIIQLKYPFINIVGYLNYQNTVSHPEYAEMVRADVSIEFKFEDASHTPLTGSHTITFSDTFEPGYSYSGNAHEIESAIKKAPEGTEYLVVDSIALGLNRLGGSNDIPLQWSATVHNWDNSDGEDSDTKDVTLRAGSTLAMSVVYFNGNIKIPINNVDVYNITVYLWDKETTGGGSGGVGTEGKEYRCTLCDYVYKETDGDPDQNIPPGTKWEDVPIDWICPVCGVDKSYFELNTP